MTSPPVQETESAPRVRSSGYWAAAGVSLAVSLAMVLPFVWLGNPSGHDIQFHAASWLDVAGQWRQGILFPRWAEWPNYGFGEPRYIFYPPLSWILGAALSLFLPVSSLPGVFILLCEVFAGISAYALLSRVVGRSSALFGTACYVANPYALVAVYLRSDYAELLACAFLPLLFLFILRLTGILGEPDRPWGKQAASVAILFAGVWLSNAPAGLVTSYAIALVIATAAVQTKSLRPLVRGGTALVLGFGLASFYLVPAAYEEKWVNIAEVIAAGLRPADNFLYTMTNNPEHTAVNWIVSTAAIVMILVTAIAALGTLRNAGRPAGRAQAQSAWPALLLLAAVSTALMTRLSSPLWPMLPKLHFIQFPWRWMCVLGVPFAFFLAGAQEPSRRRWLAPVAMAMVLAGTAVSLGYLTWWDADDFPTVQEAIDQQQGVEGTDEYDPQGNDRTDLPQNAPKAELAMNEEEDPRPLAAKIDIERWTADEKVIHVQTGEKARLLLRLLNYPAWRVRVNGSIVLPQALQEGVEQMVIPVPSGASRVEVHFGRTPDRTLGGWISGICAVFCALVFWRRSSGRA